MDLSLVIPAYNEEKTIGMVISEACSFADEVIVVDDGSVDNTSGIVSKHNVKMVRHERNLGKGIALKSGAEVATGKVLAFIDGDGQHNPSEVKGLADPILSGKSDFVIGYRDLKDAPWIRRFSNFMARSAIKVIAGQEVKDPLCGFRAISKDAFDKLMITKKGYEVEFDMIFEALRNDLKISNVPVSVDYSTNKSSITTWDNTKIIFFVLKNMLFGKK